MLPFLLPFLLIGGHDAVYDSKLFEGILFEQLGVLYRSIIIQNSLNLDQAKKATAYLRLKDG